MLGLKTLPLLFMTDGIHNIRKLYWYYLGIINKKGLYLNSLLDRMKNKINKLKILI
jgi:hypothetical protein